MEQQMIVAWWMENRNVLLRYAVKLSGNPIDAEDLVQHAFVKAIEHSDEMADYTPERVQGWLVRTVRNAYIDRVRKQGRQALPGQLPDAGFEEDFTGLHVEELLDSLPANLREIVELRHMEGMDSTEIGRRLNIPPATVRTRLRAATILIKRKRGENLT